MDSGSNDAFRDVVRRFELKFILFLHIMILRSKGILLQTDAIRIASLQSNSYNLWHHNIVIKRYAVVMKNCVGTEIIMRLELENVGKISSAGIEINGITVIAGENDTGKSTVGKMLFCIFHTFYGIETKIKEERVKSVFRVLNSYYHEIVKRQLENLKMRKLASYIVEERKMFLQDMEMLKRELAAYLIREDESLAEILKQDGLQKTAKRIYDFLAFDDDEIRKVILQKRLEAEFAMKIGHLNQVEQNAAVRLNLKNDCICFSVIKNEDIIISAYANLDKEIIYIDDPFVLDDLGNHFYSLFSEQFEHRQDLLRKLTIDQKREDFSLVDELIVKKKLQSILDKMCDVCDGDIISEDRDSFLYKTDRLKGDLRMVNLSTGMKSFVIIRRLLQNGNIDENGVIILDEPEIHLHPEWQLKFAEIIVLIQKEFHTNILLNTHSPYFLNAIEVYTEKYGIEKNCSYYLAVEEEGKTSLTDVTNETEKIYAKLAEPLQVLENIEYENTGF